MQTTQLTSNDFDKMIIESIDEVYCFDKATDEILFCFDQVRSGEITSESDVVYAEGRQGVQLAAFDRNKTAGFTCENGYVQAGALAVQLGTDLKKATNNDDIKYTIVETLKATKNNNSGDTTMKTSNVINDGLVVYEMLSDGTRGRKIPKNDATSGEDAQTITLKGDNKADKSYIVQYKAKSATGMEIINSGDKFSKNVKLVINFVAQDACSGNKYLMQCEMPNAKVSGSFSLSAGDDPAVQNFEASALLDVCSADKELFTIKMV